MMTARHLEATPRRRSGVATIELHGDIDNFVEDVLDSADAEATTDIAKAALLNLEDVNALRDPPFMH